MTPPESYEQALRRALLQRFPNDPNTPSIPTAPIAPKPESEPGKEEQPVVVLRVPRRLWPGVHDTIRAERLAVNTLRDHPLGMLALETTSETAERLLARHPDIEVSS